MAMVDKKPACGVALVGCGTVGGEVARMLVNERGALTERSGVDLELRHIVDVDFTRARALGLPETCFTKDLERALKDAEVQVVVELVGGTTVARQVMERAIQAGKLVVTANKALLAHHGNELFALARKNRVAIAFEASCGGGIPVIRALYNGLIANRIDAVFGIVNGTCNYILSAMTEQGTSYQAALAQAQAKGLAEADPTLDVSGMDTAHKLAIMAAIAFGQKIDLAELPVQGIDRLDASDVAFGKELGYVIKLLAVARRQDQGLLMGVQPVFISRSHPLAWVSGPFNAVSVYGHATGHTMYYGRGAGGAPTASAVIADLVDAALGTAAVYFRELKLWPDLAVRKLPLKEARRRFYIRITAKDEPGVLAQLAAILAKQRISISSVLQKEVPEAAENAAASGVPVVITTHEAEESAMRRAVEQIDALDVILAKSVCIGIMDEQEE
jgi:homoserine dehydrogenase